MVVIMGDVSSLWMDVQGGPTGVAGMGGGWGGSGGGGLGG